MEKRKDTLAILSPAFPADESELESLWLPAQQSLVRCINQLFPSLHIVIITFKFPLSKNQYTWFGNTVMPLGGAGKKRWKYVPVWFKAFIMLRQQKSNTNLAGIISFWCNECCLVGSYFSRLYGVKHLCWICGQDARATNKFVKRIKPRAEELVAMSDFLMNEFYKSHRIRPAHLIPDAVEAGLFDTTPVVRDIEVLGAGSLSPLKRYNIFIEVLAVLVAKGLVAKSMLCGGGTEEQMLKKKAADAGLQNMLEFTGHLPHKAVLRYMQRTKIFLHTSEYEGFGNVCIEALYAGAHVISFTRPMQQDIPHWHIVSTREEMINKAIALLESPATEYTPVLPFDMRDSAKQFITLIAGKRL